MDGNGNGNGKLKGQVATSILLLMVGAIAERVVRAVALPYGIGYQPLAEAFNWQLSLIWVEGISRGVLGLSCLILGCQLLYIMNHPGPIIGPENASALYALRNQLLKFGAVMMLLSGLAHVVALVTLWYGVYWYHAYSMFLASGAASVVVFLIQRNIDHLAGLITMADLYSDVEDLRGAFMHLKQELSKSEIEAQMKINDVMRRTEKKD